jgi:hypothetical protein
MAQQHNGQLKQCCSCCHAGYFYKKYPGFLKRQQNAQQDLKIDVHLVFFQL